MRTNTPLQAFVTLNDPVYVEAAQALARRIVREGGSSSPKTACASACGSACAARPTGGEVEVLVGSVPDGNTSTTARMPTRPGHLATEPLGPLPGGDGGGRAGGVDDGGERVARTSMGFDEGMIRR